MLHAESRPRSANLPIVGEARSRRPRRKAATRKHKPGARDAHLCSGGRKSHESEGIVCLRAGVYDDSPQPRPSVYGIWQQFPRRTVVKPDCQSPDQRKPAITRSRLLDSPFSPVRFGGLLSRNRAYFAYFEGRSADFLCSLDWVAEREGFEPSIQVLARITV